jgi:hypothetical protein
VPGELTGGSMERGLGWLCPQELVVVIRRKTLFAVSSVGVVWRILQAIR